MCIRDRNIFIWCIIADHTFRNQKRSVGFAEILPVSHPFSIAPAIGTCLLYTSEKTFGAAPEFAFVKSVNDNLARITEEKKDQNNGGMNKDELRSIFEESGADETDLETFDRVYDEVVGKGKELLPENVLNASKLEIKTEEAVVSAKLGDGSSIETKVVDGVRCLVLPLNGICSINGSIPKFV